MAGGRQDKSGGGGEWAVEATMEGCMRSRRTLESVFIPSSLSPSSSALACANAAREVRFPTAFVICMVNIEKLFWSLH